MKKKNSKIEFIIVILEDTKELNDFLKIPELHCFFLIWKEKIYDMFGSQDINEIENR